MIKKSGARKAKKPVMKGPSQPQLKGYLAVFPFDYLRGLAKDPKRALDAVREGLPVTVVGTLSQGLDVTKKTVTDVLELTPGSYDRRIKQGVLTTTESDTSLRLAGLFDLAATVLGGDDEARRWFNKTQYVLGGAVPLEFAKTSIGADYVRSVLLNIEYGLSS